MAGRGARVAIIGAGPAGLIAAEFLAGNAHAVTLYDRMPSAGRKFLLAGRGGLNLTHSEAPERFGQRYGEAAPWMAAALSAFPPAGLQAWCEGLGQKLFIGSSGRIFPTVLKAAPLLRAWLHRLDALGVTFRPRHCWRGWNARGDLAFDTPAGALAVRPEAVLLALGGASWPRMGADGAWVPILRGRGVRIADLRASNCGVGIGWSPVFAARFEGQPLKRIALSAGGQTIRGEAVVTGHGLEGGVVYALSAPIRRALDAERRAVVHLDLRPDLSQAELAARVDAAPQGKSLANVLRQHARLPPVGIGLVQEALHAGVPAPRLSALIKAVPLTVTAMQPIDRAISVAGGIGRDEVDAGLMITRLPGVFAAGEMLDWEAPTGGYLLQGCFSTGALAARGIGIWLGDAGTPR